MSGVLVALMVSAGAAIVGWMAFTLSGASLGEAAVLGVGLTLVFAGGPALALRRASRRLLRGFSAGLGAGIVVALVTLLAAGVWTRFDPLAMRPDQIDAAVDALVADRREAFYLAEEADGHDLARVEEVDGLIWFEYGRCLDQTEEGCQRPVAVTSQPTAQFGSRGETAGTCERLQPILGVPVAIMSGQLMVFTGSSMVGITYWKRIPGGFMPDEARQARLAYQLRAVGNPEPGQPLPAPDAATLAFVDKHCGSAPTG